MLSEYVEQLQLSGLIEEHEVEALEKPIRRAREALNIEMPYFPTLYNAILSNFSFSKVLPLTSPIFYSLYSLSSHIRSKK